MTVVGLGAWCDYVTEDEERDRLARSSLPAHEVAEELERLRSGRVSFRVQEFAALADGRRLTLHDERGFSSLLTVVGGCAPVDHWSVLTVESLESEVRTTVLADDDDTEQEHPWKWLAERLRAQGVDVSPGQLKQVPYVVELSQRLLAKLEAHTPTEPPP